MSRCDYKSSVQRYSRNADINHVISYTYVWLCLPCEGCNQLNLKKHRTGVELRADSFERGAAPAKTASLSNKIYTGWLFSTFTPASNRNDYPFLPERSGWSGRGRVCASVSHATLWRLLSPAGNGQVDSWHWLPGKPSKREVAGLSEHGSTSLPWRRPTPPHHPPHHQRLHAPGSFQNTH